MGLKIKITNFFHLSGLTVGLPFGKSPLVLLCHCPVLHSLKLTSDSEASRLCYGFSDYRILPEKGIELVRKINFWGVKITCALNCAIFAISSFLNALYGSIKSTSVSMDITKFESSREFNTTSSPAELIVDFKCAKHQRIRSRKYCRDDWIIYGNTLITY